MSLPDKRPPLELVAFAAWVNVPVDAIPASFLAPTCQHTMDAWLRVADAIAKELNKCQDQ
jgi:hypothetical protein